jgi:hypothetical protein
MWHAGGSWGDLYSHFSGHEQTPHSTKNSVVKEYGRS